MAAKSTKAKLASERDQMLQAVANRALGIPQEPRRFGPLEVKGTQLIFHMDAELEALLAEKRALGSK
jgi:hypothetical protein